MKSFIKSLALFCCLILIFPFISFGCSSKEDDKPTDFVPDITVVNLFNHVNNSLETNDYLIQDGKSDYQIVIARNATDKVISASNELMFFVKEATGATLNIVYDDDETVTLNNNSKYISLGKNSLYTEANINVDFAQIKSDGFYIKTVGKSIFIIGENYGTLYGVYGLLEDLFDYDFFYTNCYRLNHTENVKLKNYDIKEIPDIMTRSAGFGTMWKNGVPTLDRYKMGVYSSQIIPVKEIFHNSFCYLPYQEYKDEHPGWYNQAHNQLCYTAHGDEAEYELMVETAASVLKETLKVKEGTLITMTIMDNESTCTCQACNELYDKYDADSASVILFMNDLNKNIRDWFKTEEGKPFARDLQICLFAYFGYSKPPAKYNEETGEYEAIDDIKCDDGVSVIIAPIYSNYMVSVYDPIANSAMLNNLLGWGAVSNSILTWFYDGLFSSSSGDFTFYNTFNGYQERYQIAKMLNSQWMFNQGKILYAGEPTAFNILKMYLSSKLSWNVNLDFETLLDDFFDNMYKDASDTMRQLFDEIRAQSNYIINQIGRGGDCYTEIADGKCWPKNLLLKYHGYIDKALMEIEPISAYDNELYERCYKFICAERLSIDYLLCKSHSGELSSEEIKFYKDEFKKDANLTSFSEALTIIKQGGMD